MLPRIRLRRGSAPPLHVQLIDELRDMVLRGDLPPGTRLPPTRKAAGELGVSRNVVVLAYEQLRTEGYLEARVGAGTWIPDTLPGHLLRPEGRNEGTGVGEGAPGSVRLSREGDRLARARRLLHRAGEEPGPFLPGVPAPEHFPVRTWTRISNRMWRARGLEMVGYGEVEGYAPLREAVADYLRRHRAVRCEPGQVIITAGSQQALDLAARVLIDEGDAVGLEEPGYRGAQLAFRAAGARVIPVKVDGDGLDLAGAKASLEGVRVVHTTPSHQYPLGVTLTFPRRLELLDWARKRRVWIIEDDYDSEFRYESRPLPSLQGLDQDDRVLYLGTASKVLAPGLRLGFMVVPRALIEAFRGARTVADSHSPLILQAALAEFLAAGHLERHIARMRGIYAERRRALRTALRSRLPEVEEASGSAAGLHLTVFLPPGMDDRRVSEEAARRGIEAPALSDYCLDPPDRGGLVLGFGAVTPDAIPSAVEGLAEAVDIERFRSRSSSTHDPGLARWSPSSGRIAGH